MSTSLTVMLLYGPIVATAAYLLRYNRDEGVIVASELALYVVLTLGYLKLAMTLVPANEPSWLQAAGFLSFAAVATGLMPVAARRMSRRLTAAQTARAAKDQPE